MKKLVMTGGGTAGHVTPNLALLPALKAQGWEIEYIGSYEGIERTLVEQAGVKYHGISTGKLRRYFDLRNISDLFRAAAGIGQSRRLLREIKPDLVFSKGGFVSVPVVRAASALGIPTILHESDYTPGLANRLMKKQARYICTTFPETAKAIGGNAVFVGSPIRHELLEGDRTAGLSLCGFSGTKTVVLVMGGSQGSAAINAALREALGTLCARYDIIHLCGRGNLSGIKREGYFELEYADKEMSDLLAAADMVVSRAGANSIYEFLALHKCMLLIPLPLSASRGDQILNARSFEAQGFARVLEQESMTRESLIEAIDDTYSRAGQMKLAMKSSRAADAVKSVVGLIEKVYAETKTKAR